MLIQEMALQYSQVKILTKNVPVPSSISGPALCILNSLLTETYPSV